MDMKKKLSKESKKVLCELGYYYINSREYEKAVAIFNSLIIIDDQLPFRYGLANVFFSKSDYDKALEICRDILDDYPGDTTAKLMMAENLIFKKRDSEAAVLLDQVLGSDADEASMKLARDLKQGISQGISSYAG
jgi:tetratricopeptide (TPR) repeat protein